MTLYAVLICRDNHVESVEIITQSLTRAQQCFLSVLEMLDSTRSRELLDLFSTETVTCDFWVEVSSEYNLELKSWSPPK